METVATLTALLSAALNAGAGAYAGWRWWRVEPDRVSWVLLRAGQAATIVLAVLSGIAWLAGLRPDEGLFWIYVFVPVGTSFFAEQFRLLAAQTVLEARGLADAQAVGKLPDAQQASIVLQIMRRELGVVTLAAIVNALLALRAATEAAGL